ncbi:MAG: hypothetical protein KF851_04330 [Pirellulaceae bacterium]|nr:hypothetical protein [Pirellulaceae bacterium]
MSGDIPKFPPQDSRNYQKVVDVFLSGKGLPFAEILSAERIERVFRKHRALFACMASY